MPLKKGCSRKTVGRNIEEMKAAGHPERVAKAAALDSARGSCPRKKSLRRRRRKPR